MQLGRRWLLALAFVLAACQAAPAPPRPAMKDPAALAAEALERGDYAKAAELYRSALAAEPESLPLHYGLAVSASYLDRRTEAVSEFTWVLERGGPDSTEVKAAQRWLLSVGALPHFATIAAEPEESRPEAKSARGKPAPASVQGSVMFGDTPNDLAPMRRMRLFLYDYPTRMVYFRIRTDEQGHFRFPNVPPGIYKLTDRAAGPPRWRLRVELKPGQDMTLDLNPGNSTEVRDDFPT
jgi:tetratricopeptide (TPR) repeat protein